MKRPALNEYERDVLRMHWNGYESVNGAFVYLKLIWYLFMRQMKNTWKGINAN